MFFSLLTYVKFPHVYIPCHFTSALTVLDTILNFHVIIHVLWKVQYALSKEIAYDHYDGSSLLASS